MPRSTRLIRVALYIYIHAHYIYIYISVCGLLLCLLRLAPYSPAVIIVPVRQDGRDLNVPSTWTSVPAILAVTAVSALINKIAIIVNVFQDTPVIIIDSQTFFSVLFLFTRKVIRLTLSNVSSSSIQYLLIHPIYSRPTITTIFRRIFFFCRLFSSMIRYSKRKSLITYYDRQVKIARSTWTSVCPSPVKMAALASIESTDTYVTARKTSWMKIASGSTTLAQQILATTTGTAR